MGRSIFFRLLVALLLSTTNPCDGFGLKTYPSGMKGTRSSHLTMTVLTYGNKRKNFKPGTPLSKAVQELGVQPRYSCKKGDCATCEIFLAGRLTKPCVAKVPPEPKLKSLQEKGLEIRL